MKQLAKRWIEFLREKPESGMGYQHVDIKMKDGSVIPEVTIFNGSIIGDAKPEWRDIDPSLIAGMDFKEDIDNPADS
jgi:hypothetical protein